jgi:hypothetical protein
MRNAFSVPFVIGLAAIAVLVGLMLYMNRGAHLNLPGKILKIRTIAVDDAQSGAVADFEVTNTADYPIVVQTVTLIEIDPDGTRHEGMTSSEVDAQRFFQGMPLLGEKYNPTLVTREKVDAHTCKDRMVLATFRLPESQLRARKGFLLRVEEIDGKVFEIPEVAAK